MDFHAVSEVFSGKTYKKRIQLGAKPFNNRKQSKSLANTESQRVKLLRLN